MANKQWSTGIFDAVAHIVRESGVSGLFNGMQPQIVKAVLTQAILLVLKEEITRATQSLIFALVYSKATRMIKKAL